MVQAASDATDECGAWLQTNSFRFLSAQLRTKLPDLDLEDRFGAKCGLQGHMVAVLVICMGAATPIGVKLGIRSKLETLRRRCRAPPLTVRPALRGPERSL